MSLEDTLKNNAIYHFDGVVETDVVAILDEYKLIQIGAGTNARVYKIEGRDWVVKEGKWDLEIGVTENSKVTLPAQLTENILRFFDMSFLPEEDEILRQYELYLSFAKYFGFFASIEKYYHPNLKQIFQLQNELRESLIKSINDVEEFYLLELPDSIKEILDSDILQHNYLPKEYLLYGKSIHENNKEKKTYFIFQEFFEGTLLHDVDLKELDNKYTAQLILMAYLVLYMNLEEELVPDLRPRSVVSESYEWFAKTDNVMITDMGVKFIDTRWLWDPSSNIVKRGGLIPELTLSSAKFHLLKLLEYVR